MERHQNNCKEIDKSYYIHSKGGDIPMNPFNPEAIGVLGLVVTVFVFGLEQLGIGTKGGDHDMISKEVSYVAFWFGGVTQVMTA